MNMGTIGMKCVKVGGTILTKLRSTATHTVCAEDGQEAVTAYKVLGGYADAAHLYTLVQAEPKTGRVLDAFGLRRLCCQALLVAPLRHPSKSWIAPCCGLTLKILSFP